MGKITFLLVLLLIILFGKSYSEVINFNWEKSNEMFEHPNATLWVHMGDKLTFTCPKPTTRGYAYLKIYLVSEDEYHFCTLRPGREITVCNNSNKDLFFGFVFRQITPIPNGLLFQPNRMYYFISTSSGRLGGINQRRGGLCSSKNMKLKVFVKSAMPFTGNTLPNFIDQRKIQKDAASKEFENVVHESNALYEE